MPATVVVRRGVASGDRSPERAVREPAGAAGSTAVLLVAHGSADPRAARTTRSLASVVAAIRPKVVVRAAFLDHTGPRPDTALGMLAAEGVRRVTVVPLLLTAAYHHRVDLPAVLARAREAGPPVPVRVTDPLGPVAGTVPAPLLSGLRRRLAEAAGQSTSYDAVVLAAAGTRDRAAQATVDQAAAGLAVELGMPCLAGYASAAAPAPADAVAELRARGASRVAMAAYFLATGQLYRAAAGGARSAGAVAVAQPLADVVELAQLVCDRVDQVERPGRVGHSDRLDCAVARVAYGFGSR